LEVGRFVLGLPRAIRQDGTYLPETANALEEAASVGARLPSTWCFRRNVAVVHKFLSLAGKRSPAIQALSLVKPPPNWGRFVDHRSAATAAGPLLHGGGFGEFFMRPVLALYAAHRAEDRSLVTKMEHRTIVVLRRDIESSLREQPTTVSEETVVDARLLSRLIPSRETRLLLRRSEAALRQSEAMLEGLSS
jgi:hypothetical protein